MWGVFFRANGCQKPVSPNDHKSNRQPRLTPPPRTIIIIMTTNDINNNNGNLTLNADEEDAVLEYDRWVARLAVHH
jgi:hypothetical protein